MELREVMQKRKSIRQYLTTPVEEEKVKAMIEAAILAPTWKNAQEIRYYVAVSEEKRQAVLDALGEGNRKKTQNAPVFLISAVILNRAGFQKDDAAVFDVEPLEAQAVVEVGDRLDRVVGQVPAEDNGSVISVCLNRYYKINFIIFKRSWRNDDNKERSS